MANEATSGVEAQPPDLSGLCLAITEHAPWPIATVEAETHIVRYANPAFCTLLGKHAEELVGKPIRDLLPKHDTCLNLLSRVAQTGKPESHTEQERSTPNPVFWSYTSWPLFTHARLVGVMIQVTETAKAHSDTVAMNEALVLGSVRQHELTEAAEKANARLLEEIAAREKTERDLAEKVRLLDLTQDAVVVRGLDDRITLWNNGAQMLYGWTWEEVKGKHLHRLLRTQFPKPMEEILAVLYRGGTFTGEVVQTTKDGRKVTSVCRWILDRSTDSILTTYTDITERKQTQQELEESEERYRSLFNSIDEGFCVIELIFDEKDYPIDYTFLEVNPSFEKQSGLHDAVGKRMRELAPGHEAYWFEMYGKVAVTGQPIRYVNESKARGERWFDAYAFRVGGADSRKVAVLFTDITDRKRNEIALVKAQEQLSRHASNLEGEVSVRTAELRSSVGSLETLTYTMAHDLRAPIRAMKGFTTALLEDVPLDETGKDYALRIHSAAARMDQLINDLLEYGELTHLDFQLQPVDLKAQIENVLAQSRSDMEGTKAEVSVRDPIPMVFGNVILLEQVLSNLISNGLKFVGPGVVPRIHIRAETRGSVVRLLVEDNGIGIAPPYLKNVFGMFSRLHTTDAYPGTGVGLAIVKRAMERMRGAVGVESKVGEGSKFWIDLPIARQTLVAPTDP